MYTEQELNFINFVKFECKKNGIKCSLRNTKYVKLGVFRCSGYFDSDSKILVSSLKRPDWIEILAHEYSHLTQFVDNFILWEPGSEAMSFIEEWLLGEDYTDIDSQINTIRDLELDNEKRTVEVIKKFNLDVNLDLYIKKCNAYVLFYNWIKVSRKWSKPTNSPYTNKVLMSAMSNKFDMNYKALSPKIANIFKTENI